MRWLHIMRWLAYDSESTSQMARRLFWSSGSNTLCNLFLKSLHSTYLNNFLLEFAQT
jgi:hypothetical protein